MLMGRQTKNGNLESDKFNDSTDFTQFSRCQFQLKKFIAKCLLVGAYKIFLLDQAMWNLQIVSNSILTSLTNVRKKHVQFVTLSDATRL